MKKIIGIGDLLLSFSPENFQRFLQAEKYQVNYTGAEANVCVSLSQFGMETELLTRVPNNAIGDCAIAWMKKYGVGTQYIARGGERIGILFLERGASQRPSQVIYDRKHSAFCEASCQDFDLQHIFSQAAWFHFTGITPALSDLTAELTLDACKTAKNLGVKISCDLNYRKKLWSTQKARQIMEQLLPYVNVLIANEEDAASVLGIEAPETNVENGRINANGYVEVAHKIQDTYGIPIIATTLRESHSASDNGWSAMLFADNRAFFSRKYEIHVVDRVGGGDSFAAGLIYSMQKGFDRQKTIDFATAASCLKHSIELDFNLSTVEEVERLASGNASGRVQR